MTKITEKVLSLCLAVIMLVGTIFTDNIDIKIDAATATVNESVVWDGTAATAFSGGNGKKNNPYIIETPMQLYKMIADNGKSNGKYSYYKVSDTIDTLRLSEHHNKNYNGIKTAGDAVAASAGIAQKNWVFQNQNAFEGSFDGNGVIVTGMISKSTNGRVGLIPYLSKDAVVKNIIFDGCYAKTGGSSAGMLSSEITASTRNGYTLIDSIAVINSYIKGVSYTGGVFASGSIPDTLAFVNCLFDGKSCNTDITAGIFGAPNWTNRFQLYNCVSIGAKLAPKLTAYNENGVKYNNYNDTTVPAVGTGVVSDVHPIYISNCYSDTPIAYSTTEIDADRLKEVGYTVDFSVLTTADKLMSALSLLDWQNDWYVAQRDDGTLLPMIKKNTSTDDVLGTESENKPVLDYNKLLGTQNNLAGADIDCPYENGTYGYFYNLRGSGTKADPYIITNALELARAIGSGGKNISQKLYFKLGCDIDLDGFKWLNAIGYRISSDSDKDGKNDTLTYSYKYVPFEGVLDGDGHTVTGLYAIAPNGTEAIFNTSYNYDAETDYLNYAGLIPVLRGGTVKNLHIRDSYVGGGANKNAVVGAIAGSAESGSTILGCSVEDTTFAANNTNYITGNDFSPKNSYFINDSFYKYFDGNGEKITDLGTIDYNAGIWYKGGTAASMPRLINHIYSTPCTDIDGDGIAVEYTAADIVALKNYLMWADGYQAVYGDIDKNGVTDITDLAILQRYMVGTYNKADDGLWRNIELGNVGIFYGENDNYDAARKLELYLESIYPNVDIKKYINNTDKVYKHTNDGVKAPDGKLDIVIGYIEGTSYASDSSIGTNQYRIKYDQTNKVLWLQGENFTAVEQAVLDFIADSNSTVTTLEPTTTQICTLAAEKQPITINGNKYYYAWGDEFNGTEPDGSGMNYGNWHSREAHAERTNGQSSAYRHQEYAPSDALNKLIVVNDGKLTINRGYRKGASFGGTIINTDTAGYDGYIGLTDEEIGTANGMGEIDSTDKYFNAGSISTDTTMLFKKGYVEFMASLPADGHAFPALWLYGGGISTAYRNRGWDNSLYSKIYPINDSWDGTDYISWSNTATQKYIIPANFYELDVIELMQAYYRLSSGQQSQDRFIDYYGVDTTIHRWDRQGGSTNLVNKSYDFGSPGNKYVSGYGLTKYVYSSSYADELANLQAMRKYGFLWEITSSGTTLKTYIYNTDGSVLKTIDTSFSDGTKIDEYLQIIIDNEFYSSSTSAEYSGMLTTVSGKNAKAKLEVDYVRLYQLDNKRDMVTIETESFNTGSHFGY